MVLLEWKKICRNVKYIKKAMYGKYLFSVQYKSPGGHLLSYYDTESAFREFANAHWSFSYYKIITISKEEAIDRLLRIREIKKSGVKTRIEGMFTTFYFEQAEDALDFINNTMPDEKNDISRICMPYKGTEQDLLEGHVIRTEIPYKYHIEILGGTLSIEQKESVYQYFKNVGPDEIKYSPAFKQTFHNSKHSWLYECNWFYLNDLQHITFISLMTNNKIKVSPIRKPW